MPVNTERRSCDRAAILTHAVTPLGAMKPVLTGRYLIKGLLDRGALSCVYGAPNCGKTFAALDLAAHVAAGRTWHGHRAAGAGGPVIYVTAEGGGAFGNRVAAIRKVDPDLITAADRAGMAVLSASLDLCRGEDVRHLIEVIDNAAAAPPALVVIDTLARSMGGGNENDGADMGALIANVGRLQSATGAHVMLVHHTGKNSDRGARGHSSLKAAIDTEIELSSVGTSLVLAATKQRDLGISAPLRLRLRSVKIGHDEDGDDVFSCVIAEALPEERGDAISGNAARQSEADGRAMAALGLLPPNAPFGAADVAPSLQAAGLVKGGNQKSSVELTRRLLLKLAAMGRIADLGSGKFEVSA